MTAVHQTRDLGGLIGTRLGSGMQPSAQQEGGLGPGRGQDVLRGSPGLSADTPVTSSPDCGMGGGVVSSNRRASCSALKTMAALERGLLFVKG